MKKLASLFALVLCLTFSAQAQEIEQSLDDFSRLVVSPHINLVIRQGNQPGVRVAYSGIDRDEIHIDASGNNLKIYLDKARYVEKSERENGDYYRRGIYDGAQVTAYVTFSELEYLEIRGSGTVKSLTPITSDHFKLKAYGENVIDLPGIEATTFRLSLYGENELYIQGGQVEDQHITLYGENILDITGLKSATTKTSLYGSSNMRITATSELQINAFGESTISYAGEPVVNKKLIIGEPTFREIKP